jgi:hypothetical protein
VAEDVLLTVRDVLAPTAWTARAEAHRMRADAFTAAHRDRARRGESHPVWDFLFTYYNLQPRRLRVWHPGYGVTLSGEAATAYLDRAGYVGVPGGATVGPARLRARVPTLRFITALLRSTATRPPVLGCFGMHEWAMVYRCDKPRHTGVPLRLGQAGTDRVVESIPLRCTHFDAFRFFTPAAAARSATRPTRRTQIAWEQPGCLHAAMDLYKWAGKLIPLTDSDLLMDCLELAAVARELDMRASPYDLSEYGFAPIAVEEPTGRAQYVREQSVISERAGTLRSSLLRRCEQLLIDAGGRTGNRARIGSGDSSREEPHV